MHSLLVDAIDPRFRTGQRWSYRAREGEETSTLTVLKVESHPGMGVILHVAVDGLRVSNKLVSGGVTERACHLPFARTAIERSVLALTGHEVPADDWRDGYSQWREAFDEGKAGVFTITVAEAVDALERTFEDA
jgi:hypothetical protein